MAEAAKPAAPEKAAETEVKSSAEPILSVAVTTFYSPKGQTVRSGEKYYYTPQKGIPYPWKIMRPVDETLHEKCKAEYDAAKQAKFEKIEKARSLRAALSSVVGE